MSFGEVRTMNTVTPTTRTHNGGGTLLPVLILGCLALIYPLRAELMHALGIKFDVQSSTAMGTKVRVSITDSRK